MKKPEAILVKAIFDPGTNKFNVALKSPSGGMKCELAPDQFIPMATYLGKVAFAYIKSLDIKPKN